MSVASRAADPARSGVAAQSALDAAQAADVPATPATMPGLLTIGVMAATIMQILDSTIANVALPHMQASLGATADTVTWVLTSYIIASAAAIPITGWLADRLGSRRLFLISVVGFVLASMACGLAQNLDQMVIFRVFQGIFAAFLNPLSQSVMLDINRPSRHARAMSIWGMGIMIGPILGPLLGGWLTENYNWRWVFYVNVPIGILCFAVLSALLPSRPLRRRKFDLFGFSLLAIAIGALQLMLDRGQANDWFQSTEVIIEAGVSLAAWWMFAVHMLTARNPMFDRAMLANRNLVTSLIFMLVVGLVVMAVMALLPPLLQTLYGYPVLDTGLLLMPRGVGVLISMAVAGQLIQRGFDTRILIGTGTLLTAYSLYTMTQWTLVMGSSPIVLSGLIQGLGMGLIFIPLNVTAFATLQPQYRTEASSLLNLCRNLGASVGISICTTVLARNLQISHADLAGQVTAYNTGNIDPAITAILGSTGDTMLAALNGEVTRQAAMIAYLDDFWMMMILTGLSVFLVLFLRKPKLAAKADPKDLPH
ncbi:DHA2 family efflux MFS transporter permease subunit [Sphingorhabdus soli]|uniref:DHA2 family efflux MFS transporter permease subunit n=1 Tax=Flavisphingopyxis soli TaxID=2601267 RepID=A0A5C6U883_9SPHN|nr:DHA2 family efflux MFS transporter permease subunit [Sphingorhabdus soli]TXC69039.1 DHA2 family efflux MFS transporter permease subunit [Sphingorhabdus soli]